MSIPLSRATPSAILLEGNEPLQCAFGKYEAELTGCSIVRYAQGHGDWVPFNLAEITRVHTQHYSKVPLRLDWLLCEGYLRKDGELYAVTDDFVAACVRTSSITLAA